MVLKFNGGNGHDSIVLDEANLQNTSGVIMVALVKTLF